MKTKHLQKLPEHPSPDIEYYLTPRFDERIFRERTSRHRIFVTQEEMMDVLYPSKIAIAGCGGMGGLSVATLVRWGFGEIRMCDNQKFDHSNRNRQFAATLETIDCWKAFETARAVRKIADDIYLRVHAQGITPENACQFVKGATRVLDEIEFFALGSRMLLHDAARSEGVIMLSASSAGFAVFGVKWPPDGMSIQEVTGLETKDALRLQMKYQDKKTSSEDLTILINAALRIAAPRVPEYSARPEKSSSARELFEMLLRDQTAPITASGPVMSTGFLVSNLVDDILSEKSPVERTYELIPPMPGYKTYDSRTGKSETVKTPWG